MIFSAIIAVALLAFAYVAWKNFSLSLLLILSLLPSYLIRFSLGPLPTTLLECMLGIAVLIAIIKDRAAMFTSIRNFWHHAPTLLRAALLILAAASILGILVAPNHVAALGIWRAYYIEPAIFAVLAMTFLRAGQQRSILIALAGSASIIALFALMQVTTRLGIPDAWLTEGRATGFFAYPNAVGLFLAPITSLLAVIALFSLQITRAHRALLLGTSLLLTLGILVAKTEAALVAIPASLILALWISGIPSIKTKIAATSVAALLLVVICALSPTIVQKLTLMDTSGLVRRSQWSETLRMLADHPIVGVGISGYPTALVPYHDASQYEIFQYPHNLVLNIWSELGVLGLIAFVLLLVVFIKHLIHHRNDVWILAAGAALMTMMIHGLVDVPFFKNDLALLTAVFAIVLLQHSPKTTSRPKLRRA